MVSASKPLETGAFLSNGGGGDALVMHAGPERRTRAGDSVRA